VFGERRLVRLAQLGGAVALALAAAIASSHPAAADHGGQQQTFADIVDGSRLIVVARITIDRDGGVVLDVERVLKGEPIERLAFAPTDLGPPLEGWDRAMFAFTDPTTIDARAPTIAWHVADDGVLDPEGFQQAVGLPATLDAVVAAFGQDPIEPVAAALPAAAPPLAPSPADSAPAILAALIVVAIGLLGALVLGQRWREAQ
jgi:hypothetical protein